METEPCPDCGLECEATQEGAGEHLGYPPCCIEDFNAWSRVFDLLLELGLEVAIPEIMQMLRPSRKLNGTGFIPCTWHDSDTYTEEALVTLINRNRDCSRPFLTLEEEMLDGN